jgi:hypothetical protein
MNVFNTYVSSIFLYNSKLWTITSSLEKQIDSFYRRLIRTYIFRVKWPDIIKNEQLYKKTNETLWSEIIEKRKMKWLGHVLRLPQTTPARMALTYALEHYDKSMSRPKTTWISKMKEMLNSKYHISWDTVCRISQDRNEWQNIINSKTVSHNVNLFTKMCRISTPINVDLQRRTPLKNNSDWCKNVSGFLYT